MLCLNDLANRYNLSHFQKVFQAIQKQKNKNRFCSDQQLQESFLSMQQEIRLSSEPEKLLDAKLPEVYALTSEVIKRKLGLEPHREQLLCAIGMHHSFITEMKSGEGKTLAAVFPAVLNSLANKVFLVTVNDYLARRDCANMLPVYQALGLEVLANQDRDKISEAEKQQVYTSDIIYTSSSSLVFDYLWNRCQGNSFDYLNTAIVDEIDFVLIDNANSNFTVSEGKEQPRHVREYHIAKEIYPHLRGQEIKGVLTEEKATDPLAHYIYSPKDCSVALTEEGFNFFSKIIGKEDIANNYPLLYKAILYILEAQLFHQNGKDYIVDQNQICLINQANGRIMPFSSRENGLQLALEVKENVAPNGIFQSGLTTSYQVFFAKFKKLTGMSATVRQAKKEFNDIFNLPAVAIPTHSKTRRIDHHDIVCRTKQEKYEQALKMTQKVGQSRQPILLVAGSEQESINIYNLLVQNMFAPNLLNAQQTAEEEQLVKNAGRAGTITVSTNLVGRGTDIILDEEAIKVGGLFVLSLNRYESKRIDEQVKGRAARQGQPGEAQFIISLEDYVWRFLPPLSYQNIAKIPSHKFYSKNAQHRLAEMVGSLQENVDYACFEQRRMLFNFDMVLDNGREMLLGIKEQISDINTPWDILSFADFQGEREDFEQKIAELGEKTATRVLKDLLNYFFAQKWADYQEQLNSLRDSTPFLSLTLTTVQLFKSFIEHTCTVVDNFRLDIVNHSVNAFLTARKKSSMTKQAVAGKKS